MPPEALQPTPGHPPSVLGFHQSSHYKDAFHPAIDTPSVAAAAVPNSSTPHLTSDGASRLPAPPSTPTAPRTIGRGRCLSSSDTEPGGDPHGSAVAKRQCVSPSTVEAHNQPAAASFTPHASSPTMRFPPRGTASLVHLLSQPHHPPSPAVPDPTPHPPTDASAVQAAHLPYDPATVTFHAAKPVPFDPTSPHPPRRPVIALACPTPASIPLLQTLHQELFPIAYNDRFYKTIMENRDVCRLAFCERECVGAICCRRETMTTGESTGTQRLYVMTLGVLAPFRRLGVGSILVDTIVSVGESDPHLEHLTLHVQTTNDEALRFYCAKGFRMEARVDGYYNLNKGVEPPDAFLLRRDFHPFAHAVNRTPTPTPAGPTVVAARAPWMRPAVDRTEVDPAGWWTAAAARMHGFHHYGHAVPSQPQQPWMPAPPPPVAAPMFATWGHAPPPPARRSSLLAGTVPADARLHEALAGVGGAREWKLSIGAMGQVPAFGPRMSSLGEAGAGGERGGGWQAGGGM
ncbi:hypothetical protein HDU96_000641 [Phlyctochytrium bullatum]|nr:hypothetical protein HDU96_000641 [Phlyctochytrium bullatum]